MQFLRAGAAESCVFPRTIPTPRTRFAARHWLLEDARKLGFLDGDRVARGRFIGEDVCSRCRHKIPPTATKVTGMAWFPRVFTAFYLTPLLLTLLLFSTRFLSYRFFLFFFLFFVFLQHFGGKFKESVRYGTGRQRYPIG